MFSVHRKNLFVFFLSVFLAGHAFAEPNFDFFFKTDERYKDVVVQEVLSTDTIRLEGESGEKGQLIRLIGLRAPEPPKKRRDDVERDEMGFVIPKPVDPMTPLNDQAFAFAQSLLLGARVRLEFDTLKENEEHYTLAYVFLIKDNTFVNAEILRRGFAHLSIQPPNIKYADDLRAAYKEARAEQRGLQAH